jgi:hypothetical protein
MKLLRSQIRDDRFAFEERPWPQTLPSLLVAMRWLELATPR